MIEYDSKYDGLSYLPEPRLIIKPGTFTGSVQELRELILEQVEEYPESFHMDSWIHNEKGVESLSSEPTSSWLENVGEGTSSCGTTMCIAGYAQMFVEGKIDDNVETVAKDALGLESTALFYMSNQDARRELERLVNEGAKVNA
jgi:hypothetical protein